MTYVRPANLPTATTLTEWFNLSFEGHCLLIEEAIRLRGENYVYPLEIMTTDVCQYRTFDPDADYDSPTGCIRCIIGMSLFLAGVPYDDDWEGKGVESLWHRTNGYDNEPARIFNFLTRMQNLQDAGHSWANAYARAKNYYYEYRNNQ